MSLLGGGPGSGRRESLNRPMKGTTMATRDKLSTRIEILFARLVMIVLAIGIVFLGYTLLTTPWAIPMTVGLWLGGVAIAALGVRGKLPDDV